MHHSLTLLINPEPPRLLTRQRRMEDAFANLAGENPLLQEVKPLRPVWLREDDLLCDRNATVTVEVMVEHTGDTDWTEQDYLDFVFGNFLPDSRDILPSYRAVWNALREYEARQQDLLEKRPEYGT